MVNFTVYLVTGEVKQFDNFVDEEGMGCYYNEDGTLFSFDADKKVFIEYDDGESVLYEYDKVVVS